MAVAAAEALLEACIDHPDRLPDAMGRAGRALGFDYFCLVSSNLAQPAFIVPEEQREGIARYFDGGWVNIDYRARTERPLPLNTLYLDHRAVPTPERKRSAIYNELFLPMRMAHYAGIRFELAGEEWFCFVSRAEEAGEIDGEAARNFARVARVAMNSASIAARLHRTRADGMLEGLEHSGIAGVLLDRTGRVTAVTPAAEKLFTSDFGVRSRRLWSANSADAAGLAELSAIALGAANDAPLRRRVLVRGQRRARPLILTATRVIGPLLDQLPGARLLITIEDFGRRHDDVTSDLVTLFGLTHAEAQVASSLAQRLDISAIAARRDVAESTIRKQVAAIYRKLHVNRQTELAEFLTRLKR